MSEIIKINTISNSFTLERDLSAMQTIDEHFEYEKTRRSDINEHLDTLKKYSLECSHITECGVRNVVSTWAFLAARPKKYIGVDILPCPVQKAEALAKAEGIDFSFFQADTIHPDFVLEETDLLFIDTYHVYAQLRKELEIHNEKVRKYIIMHDTTCFGQFDQFHEEYSEHIPDVPGKTGLWLAIIEFLESNDNWYLLERFENNNGLTILARK